MIILGCVSFVCEFVHHETLIHGPFQGETMIPKSEDDLQTTQIPNSKQGSFYGMVVSLNFCFALDRA